jgi:hypothetical protein
LLEKQLLRVPAVNQIEIEDSEMSVAEDASTIDQVDCLYNEFIMAGTLIRAPALKTEPDIKN